MKFLIGRLRSLSFRHIPIRKFIKQCRFLNIDTFFKNRLTLFNIIIIIRRNLLLAKLSLFFLIHIKTDEYFLIMRRLIVLVCMKIFRTIF